MNLFNFLLDCSPLSDDLASSSFIPVLYSDLCPPLMPNKQYPLAFHYYQRLIVPVDILDVKN